MIALALDPGVTTGYAIGYLNEHKLTVACDERKFTLAELYDYIQWFHQYEPYVIYEDFQYRNVARSGLNLTPVKMIGVIELLAEDWWGHKAGDDHFFKQTPAQGKGFYTDEKLKNMNLYKVGKAHGRDATRHLLQWLTFGPGSQFGQWICELIEPGDIYELIRGNDGA